VKNPNYGPIRLARFLAAGGLGSRRACEELIRQGSVSVNGVVVTTPAVTVDSAGDVIYCHGAAVQLQLPICLVLYKPPGVTCSLKDPHAERLVSQLLPTGLGRLFPVGRLDRDSEGLLLMTNDGALSQRVAHPSFEIQKTYLVTCDGIPSRQDLARLRQGVVHRGEMLKPHSLAVVRRLKSGVRLKIVLTQGKKREIRRLCAAVGLRVVRLLRVAIGRLRLGNLQAGSWRQLTPMEIKLLLCPEVPAVQLQEGLG